MQFHCHFFTVALYISIVAESLPTGLDSAASTNGALPSGLSDDDYYIAANTPPCSPDNTSGNEKRSSSGRCPVNSNLQGIRWMIPEKRPKERNREGLRRQPSRLQKPSRPPRAEFKNCPQGDTPYCGRGVKSDDKYGTGVQVNYLNPRKLSLTF